MLLTPKVRLPSPPILPPPFRMFAHVNVPSEHAHCHETNQ